MKTLLSVTLGCTIGAVAALSLIDMGHLTGGVVIAIAAGLLLLAELLNAMRRDRRRMRREREAVWRRRIETGWR